MSDNRELIEKVLRGDPQDIPFEEVPVESGSPLSEPVAERHGSNSMPEEPHSSHYEENAANPDGKNLNADGENLDEGEDPYSDAPPQNFNDPEENKEPSETSGFKMDSDQATMMADTLIGTIDTLLFEVGAGYFVTIRKHQQFYDYEELITIIDEQNAKNVRRIKLDEDDKAMLRPLLAYVISKQTGVITPEQQLLAVCVSIIVKKYQVFRDIRQENAMLEQRLLAIIEQERIKNLENNPAS